MGSGGADVGRGDVRSGLHDEGPQGRLRLEQIKVGTASWTDKTLLASGWYPKDVDTPSAVWSTTCWVSREKALTLNVKPAGVRSTHS